MLEPNKIVYSSRKTIAVCITGDGDLIVRAPYGTPRLKIDDFLKKKEKWIEKHVLKRRAKKAYGMPKNSLDGYVFPLLGEDCTIRVALVKRPLFEEGIRTLFIPSGDYEQSVDLVKKWLKEYARKILEEIVKIKALQMKAAVTSLSITQAKTRWGSCSGKNRLNFSFRLIFSPIAMVEYVAVHELAHVFHKDHSKAFWTKVAEFCPDYKKKRAFLKERSWYMSLF